MESPDPIDRLRTGDPEAFEAVYGRYRPRIYAFLVRLTGRPALAEDLLQETFLRLARHAAELAPDTRLGAWLFTVARNLVRDARRRDLLDLDRVARWGEWQAIDRGGGPSPFEAAAADQAASRLERALAALPFSQREILLLCGVERLEPVEAAAVLGVSGEAARQRLSRSRAALREMLSKLEGEPA